MSILAQAVELVSEPPGNLVYHLVLVFALGMAASLSLSHWQQTRQAQSGRLALAAGGLLLGRMALMVAAGLAWQSSGAFGPLLPPLDRAVAAASIWILVWVIAFPVPNRAADVVLAGALFLITAGFLISAIQWAPLAGAGALYNGHPQETIWEIVILVSLAFGLALLVLQRPPDTAPGLAIMLLLVVGHFVHLVSPLQNANFPGAVRLAELAAMPLVAILALRRTSELTAEYARDFIPALTPGRSEAAPNGDAGSSFPARPNVAETASAPPASLASSRTPQNGFAPSPGAVSTAPDRYPADTRALIEITRLAARPGSGDLPLAIVTSIGRAMQADLCLFLSPPDPEDHISITCGFELNREIPFPATPSGPVSVPAIASAIRYGKPIRLQAHRHRSELAALTGPIGLKETGPSLLAPLSRDGRPLGAILVLSPAALREWTRHDQDLLGGLAGAVTEVIEIPRLQDLDRAPAGPVQSPWKPGPVIEPVDVSSVIDKAFEGLGQQLRERGILLSMDIPDDLPPVMADRNALNLIISFLLANASAACPREGLVVFTVRLEENPEDGASGAHLLISAGNSGDENGPGSDTSVRIPIAGSP